MEQQTNSQQSIFDFVFKAPLRGLGVAVVFLVAIAFSIKNLREPDLWWQIRTGEWILENHQIPKQDVFSFTYGGAEWINVKWGSEVLLAFITKISGPECVFLLQALVSCLIVFFLLKAADIRHKTQDTKTLAALFSVLLSLVAIEYRIIGRPEMFSHLLSVVFLFFLLRERTSPSRKIFWLIPLQIIWANLHEAFGVGIVLTAIFTAGAWIEYFLAKKKWLVGDDTNKGVALQLPKQISLVLLLQTASVIVNPNGVKLLLRPLQILGQVYENKYTTELFDYTMPEYWQWNVYWAIGLLTIGAVGTFIYFRTHKTKSNRLKLFVEEFGVGYLLTLVAFFYLAATAYRNIVFLVLISFPLFVFGFNFLFSKLISSAKSVTAFSLFFALSSLLLYASIVTNKYYELTNSRDRFGLEVLSTFNPSGAANFVQQQKLSGNCFSDYLTSSYLLWKLQPEFKTFIDLRDLDVFPTDFFSTFAEAVTFPDAFEKQDSLYRFKYVVLFRPQFALLHNYLFNESNFTLAYADAVACVYTRKKSAQDSSQVIFQPAAPIENSWLAKATNKLLNPFYSSFDYNTTDNNLLAASYYIGVGKANAAESFAMKSAAGGAEAYKGKEMLGQVYYKKALAATTAEAKTNLLFAAQNFYQQSIAENDAYASAQLGLGAVFFQQQNYKAALEKFERAIELDKLNLTAYNFAAECCKYFINQNSSQSPEYVEQCIQLYRQSDKLNPENPTILLNLGVLYFRKNDCDNTKKYLSRVVNFEGLSDADRTLAKDCLRKCGSM